MPQLYAAAYHSRRERQPDRPSETAAALYAAAASGEFPYDGGDDPSFFCARHHDGPVTWGVCRADVRSAIQRGDWIVFFSLQQDKGVGTTAYRLAAALCVEEKITHTEIFGGTVSGRYSNYLNLLIRPSGRGWERFEPGLHPRYWHDDWLWRICRDRGLHKDDVIAASERHRAGQPLPLPAARNYVVFSKSSAIIARNPPLIATHRKGLAAETWEPDAGSQAIRAAVFGESPRALRITNPQRAHRHFRRCLNDPAWPRVLRDALALTDWQADPGMAARGQRLSGRARSGSRC
jgi:hypothetical protein